MTWIVGTAEEEEFFSKLKDYPDRVVGLLTPSIVDKRLETAIRARWQDNERGIC